MSKKHTDQEIHEFAATLSVDEKQRLVKGCSKKLIKCNLQAWYECVSHGRYWDNKLDGCTRPFQDSLTSLDLPTEARRS